MFPLAFGKNSGYLKKKSKNIDFYSASAFSNLTNLPKNLQIKRLTHLLITTYDPYLNPDPTNKLFLKIYNIIGKCKLII